MIKNDFRYIVKKIIIGIGIIIGVSMIRSCKVYAQDLPGNVLQTTKSYITSNSDYVLLFSNSYRAVYQNKTNGYIAVTNQSSTAWISTLDLPNDEQFYYNKIGISLNPTTDTVSSKIFLTYDTQLPKLNGLVVTPSTYWSTYGPTMVISYGNGPYTTGSFSVSYYDSAGTNNIYGGSTNLSSFNFRSNIEWNYVGTSNTSSTIDLEPYEPSVPEIISLNPTLNKNENVLTSVSFSPEFSFIDIENFNYYAWFNGYDKFLISENNTTFNTQNNTTFYVEITDKEGNTIDSETYTISRIGQYDVSEYQIFFTNESYTESDTTNESKPVDYINRVDIDMLYMPKSPYLKYQYQFVKEEESLTDNWITINPESSSDLSKNDYVFTTYDNGTLYARIIDLSGVLQYSSTYTITSIGDVKYYANDTGVGGFFDKIINKLDYSGPISSLISVPIRLFSSLLTESSKSCTPYTFGNLLGSDITFSCVNVENYIGSNLYHLLDLLMSFGIVLGIIHFIKKQYNKFTSLNDKTDDIM